MSSYEAKILRASEAARHVRADRLAQVFELYVRAASPALANALAAKASDPVAVMVAGVSAIVGRSDGNGAVAAYDTLRQSTRTAVSDDAILGRALVAALSDILGPAFDEAAREVWTAGYVRLVETVMAARRNRMDLVA